MSKSNELANEIANMNKKGIVDLIKERREMLNNSVDSYMNDFNKTSLNMEDLALIMTEGFAYTNLDYSAKDYEHLLEWYKQVVPRLSDLTDNFVPSKHQFCQMVGITVEDFEHWKLHGNKSQIKVLNKIEDYIVSLLISGANSGRYNVKFTQYQLEAVHGIVVTRKQETTIVDKVKDRSELKNKFDQLFKVDEVVDAEFEEKENGNE